MNPKIGNLPLVYALVLAGAPLVCAEIEVYGTSPSDFKIVGASESSPAFQQVLTAVNPWGLAFHPDTGVVYFSDPTAGIIGSIDPAAPVPSVTEIINRPGAVFHGIALDAPNNRLFFLDSADNSVNAVNLGNLVETRIVSGLGINRPNDIAYDPVRNWIVFTESGADGIGIIKDDQPVTSFQGILLTETVGAWGVVVHPENGDIYFSSFDNGAIYLLDPNLATAAAVATNLNGPRGLKFDRFGRLFCLESGLNHVTQIPLAGQSVTAPVFADAVNGRAFLVFDGSDRDGDLLPDEWERRFDPSLLTFNAGSDTDQDGRSAFDEWLFNATPLSGADPPPVRTLNILPGGGLSAVFEGPREGYQFGVSLSSDLQNWQPWTGGLSGTALADPLFNSWQLKVEDPAALGLDPGRVFVRFTGSVSQP